MITFIFKATYAVQDFFLYPYIYYRMRLLGSKNDETARRVSKSIRYAFDWSMDPREMDVIDAIEKLRTQLESSRQNLEIIDYGAKANSSDGSVTMRVLGDITAVASKPKRWALLLFYLITHLRAQRCLEFGTCVGISTLYQSAALKLNGTGTIITMEGSENLAGIAKNNFNNLKCDNIVSYIGSFDSILDNVLSIHQPFDLVFIDGHHEGRAMLRYFDRILASLSPNAVVIFDDIHWSISMKKAWNTIISHQRVKHSVDLYLMGIIIIS